MTVSRETILEALSQIPDAHTSKDVVTAGLISGIVVRGGQVGFSLDIPPTKVAAYEPVRLACEQAIARLKGVEKVTAVMTAESEGREEVAPQKSVAWNRDPIAGVRHIIAVASGKGGVGKSTVTICLAHAFKKQGLKVGVLDADIYGPSIPLMLNLHGKPDVKEGQMLPLQKNGFECMSIGFILGDDAAIMRAPMVTKALVQMLRGVKWHDIDVLLIDMPPGTGDIHLSLAQQAPLSGALVVTTPQKVALIDAAKAVQMFGKVAVPVFGIVENMSYFEAGGQKIHPFGAGGGERLAKNMETAFLGEIPLLPELCAALDQGQAPKLYEPIEMLAHTLSRQLDLLPVEAIV